MGTPQHRLVVFSVQALLQVTALSGLGSRFEVGDLCGPLCPAHCLDQVVTTSDRREVAVLRLSSDVQALLLAIAKLLKTTLDPRQVGVDYFNECFSGQGNACAFCPLRELGRMS